VCCWFPNRYRLVFWDTLHAGFLVFLSTGSYVLRNELSLYHPRMSAYILVSGFLSLGRWSWRGRLEARMIMLIFWQKFMLGNRWLNRETSTTANSSSPIDMVAEKIVSLHRQSYLNNSSWASESTRRWYIRDPFWLHPECFRKLSTLTKASVELSHSVLPTEEKYTPL